MLDSKSPYSRRYASLSISDLLDAREAYHVRLMQMENVFATAKVSTGFEKTIWISAVAASDNLDENDYKT